MRLLEIGKSRPTLMCVVPLSVIEILQTVEEGMSWNRTYLSNVNESTNRLRILLEMHVVM